MEFPCRISPFLTYDDNDPSEPFSLDVPADVGCRLITQYYREAACTNQAFTPRPLAPQASTTHVKFDEEVEKRFPDSQSSGKVDGFCAVLVGRAKMPAWMSMNAYSLGLYRLPMPTWAWSRVTKRFRLHDFSKKAIGSQVPYSFITKHDDEGNGDKLLMFSGSTGSIIDGLGASVTYSTSQRLTTGVLFGCTSQKIQEAQGLLSKCGDSKNHPLLVIGTFVELQWRAMQKNAYHIDREWRIFQDEDYQPENERTDSGIKLTNMRINKLRDMITDIRGSVPTCRRNTKSVIDYFMTLEGGEPGWEWVRNDVALRKQTARFKQRFEAIDYSYQDLTIFCENLADEMTQKAQQFIAETSRRQAKLATQQATAGIVLALVATIMLPIATTATIFSMPIFNFEHNPVDLNWNPIDMSSEDIPFFTGYLWPFLGISLFLLFVSLAPWFIARSRMKQDIGTSTTKHGHVVEMCQKAKMKFKASVSQSDSSARSVHSGQSESTQNLHDQRQQGYELSEV